MMEYLQFAFNYGVPTGILLIVFRGLWLAAKWLGLELLIPLKHAAIKHLDDIGIHLKRSDDATDSLSTTMKSTCDTMSEVCTTMQGMQNDIKNIKLKVESCPHKSNPHTI